MFQILLENNQIQSEKIIIGLLQNIKKYSKEFSVLDNINLTQEKYQNIFTKTEEFFIETYKKKKDINFQDITTYYLYFSIIQKLEKLHKIQNQNMIL